MSVTEVQNRLVKFLLSDTEKLACLRGEWGVGKTHLFFSVMEKSQKEISKTKWNKFSYTSFFGSDSISSIKQNIFEQTVQIEDVSSESKQEKTIKEIADDLFENTFSLIRKRSGIVSLFSKDDTARKLAAISTFFLVRNQIVCLDDIERKSESISIQEALGLANFLANERNCKVLVIINEAETGEEDGKVWKYIEKISEKNFEIRPTVRESFDLADLNHEPEADKIYSHCEKLSIKNIRIIQKIISLYRESTEILAYQDEEIFSRIRKSLCLFAASVYQVPNVPSPEYIRNRYKAYSFLFKKADEISEEEKQKNALLSTYGFGSFQEIEEIILDAVRQGYFDTEALKDWEYREIQIVRTRRAQENVRRAWECFHHSFRYSEEEVVAIIGDSIRDNLQYLGPWSLDGYVGLLRQLGRNDEANVLIEKYIDQVNIPDEELDWRSVRGVNEIEDEKLREEYFAVRKNRAINISVSGLLEKFRSGDRRAGEAILNLEDEEIAKRLREADTCEFKNIIQCLLYYRNVVNADEVEKEVTVKTERVLRRFAQEAPINRLRVRGLGVDPEGS